MKNEEQKFNKRVKSKKIFVFAIGLFSNGKVYMTPNDSFACAEQNLIYYSNLLKVEAVEVYVYKVSYDVSSGRPTILVPTTIDPCCLCASLLSNILLSPDHRLLTGWGQRRWNFWGRGNYEPQTAFCPPEVNPWRADCNEKFIAKRKFVMNLIATCVE